MSNQHGPRFAKETLQGRLTPNPSCSQTTKESAMPNVGKWRWQSSSQRWSGSFHRQDWLADVPKLMPFISRDMLRYSCSKPKEKNCHSGYLHTKFSQSDNNSRVPVCLRVQCTFSASAPVFTNTSVPGFTKTNCNNPSNVSHTWPACDSAQLFKFRSKKT